MSVVKNNQEAYSKIISYHSRAENYRCKTLWNNNLPYIDRCDLLYKPGIKASSLLKYLLIKSAYIEPDIKQFTLYLNEYISYLEVLSVNGLTLVDSLKLAYDRGKLVNMMIWLQAQIDNDLFLEIIKSTMRNLSLEYQSGISIALEDSFMYGSEMIIRAQMHGAPLGIVYFFNKFKNVDSSMVYSKLYSLLYYSAYYSGLSKFVYDVNDSIHIGYKLLNAQMKDVSVYISSDKDIYKRKYWDEEINSIDYFKNPMGRKLIIGDGSPSFEEYIIKIVELSKTHQAFKRLWH